MTEASNGEVNPSPPPPPQKGLNHKYPRINLSQMLYNCNSWAAPKKFLDKLDACHRRHLCTITGHHWPDSVISNNALYKMWYVVPLSVRVNQQRWSMFSHVLQMPTSAGVCSTGIQQIQIPYRPSLLKPAQLIAS